MHGRGFLGIILIILGAGILLDRLSIIAFSSLISTYWPVILIAAGGNQLLNKWSSSSSGAILILIGIFFLLRNLGLFPGNLTRYFWPILLIIIGILILVGKSGSGNIPDYDDDTLNHFVFFGGLESRSISKDFKGGNSTAVFGGVDMDLRDAELSKDGAALDLTAVFGGIDIKVPEHWHVMISGVPIFGGWENKTKAPVIEGDEEGPMLKVRCYAVFGGVNIGN